MNRLVGCLTVLVLLAAMPAWAYDGIVEKKTFAMPAYTTVGGTTIKGVRVGYEAYGTLNAARDNVILVAHFYSGNSHAAGKVERIVPVVGAAELNAYGIGWLGVWAAPIMLDPRWNKGDYYGQEEPVEGLALALKIVTLHARHYGWASGAFGRKWAAAERDPAKSWDNKFAIEDTLDKIALARARASDANSFLYLAKANQLFVTGGKGSLEEGLRAVKARVLLVPAKSDLLLFPDYSRQAMEILKRHGNRVQYFEIEGEGGHLDGVLSVAKAGEVIRKFLSE